MRPSSKSRFLACLAVSFVAACGARTPLPTPDVPPADAAKCLTAIPTKVAWTQTKLGSVEPVATMDDGTVFAVVGPTGALARIDPSGALTSLPHSGGAVASGSTLYVLEGDAVTAYASSGAELWRDAVTFPNMGLQASANESGITIQNGDTVMRIGANGEARFATRVTTTVTNAFNFSRFTIVGFDESGVFLSGIVVGALTVGGATVLTTPAQAPSPFTMRLGARGELVWVIETEVHRVAIADDGTLRVVPDEDGALLLPPLLRSIAPDDGRTLWETQLPSNAQILAVHGGSTWLALFPNSDGARPRIARIAPDGTIAWMHAVTAVGLEAVDACGDTLVLDGAEATLLDANGSESDRGTIPITATDLQIAKNGRVTVGRVDNPHTGALTQLEP